MTNPRQSYMQPWETFSIGERVIVKMGVTLSGRRRSMPRRSVVDGHGVIASSGGPSGHAVELDDGRVAVAQHEDLRPEFR